MAAGDLAARKCRPCEGGVPPLTPDEVRDLSRLVPLWAVTADGKRIRREWKARDFLTALDFFNRIGELAEAEGHHPDMHLANYRDVAVEIWTHAVGGLSANDFILAAKIDRLRVAVKT